MEVSAELYKGGRITIPAQIRNLFNMKGGDELTFRVENDAIMVLTEAQILEEARAALRADVSADHSLVDELIAERRVEAAKENLEDAARSKNNVPKDVPNA